MIDIDASQRLVNAILAGLDVPAYIDRDDLRQELYTVLLTTEAKDESRLYGLLRWRALDWLRRERRFYVRHVLRGL